MATSKSLKTAVKKETKVAEKRASEGNVSTTKAPAPAPKAPPDLRTGQRRGHEPGEPAAPRAPYDGGINPGAALRSKLEGGADLATGERSHPESA